MYYEIGSKGEEVKIVQRYLVDQGYSVAVDGIYGSKTEKAVEKFQRKSRLYVDGIVGPVTMDYLTKSIYKDTKRMSFKKLSCDKYEEGYDSTTLREDAYAALSGVLDELHDCGAVLTSSGGKRTLAASIGPNRSKTSFHYTGRAHDLYIYSGMVDPDNDPCVIERGKDRRWVVWAKTRHNGDVKTINACIHDGSRQEITGQFINLTELMDEYGFKNIRSRRRFWNTGKGYLGAEWWHFQYENGLVEGKTTFGDELVRVYPVSTLEKYSIWNYRDYIYGVNWF